MEKDKQKEIKKLRARHLQLTQIAIETLEFLDSKGVTVKERCEFRRIAEDISNKEAYSQMPQIQCEQPALTTTAAGGTYANA
jgi:hypothetical protein